MMKKRPRVPREFFPADYRDPVAMGDWAELRMLVTGRKRLSRVDIRNAVRQATLSDGDDVELSVESVVREVRARERIGASSYPFVLDGDAIGLKPTASALAYSFLLCASASPLIREQRALAELDVLFDYIVLDALRTYLGNESRGIRFGWPVTGGRPTDFANALDWIAGQMRLERGPAKETGGKKDGGVDVIVWRPFSDARPGFLSILAQCTVQFDWIPKSRDVIGDVWAGWLDFGKMPQTCLAVPFVVPGVFRRWDETRRTVNIILERIRIASLVKDKMLSRRAETRRWVEIQLRALAG